MPVLPPTILAVNRSLNRIANSSRGELCKLAGDLTDVPWVREAFWYANDRDIRCLGRFDINGPDGQTGWPAVLIEVRRRPRHPGQTDRKALIAVYVNFSGEWEASTRQSEKVPWPQWRGDPEGDSSHLNGDDPRLCPDLSLPSPS